MWPFKKPDQKSSVETQAFFEVSTMLSQLSDQVAKFIRWSYRSQKTTSESLANIERAVERIHEHSADSEAKSQAAVDYVIRGLIAWLDDLDTLTHETNKEPGVDLGLLRHWSSQILDHLAHLGYEELAVWGQAFDPSLAEALGTTTVWSNAADPPALYTVTAVLRRGFRCSTGIYRKAQVLVYNETV